MQSRSKQSTCTIRDVLQGEGQMDQHQEEVWIRFENIEKGTFWEFIVYGNSYRVREGEIDGDAFFGKPTILPGSGNSTIFASQTGFSRTKTIHRQLKSPESVERSITSQIERRENAGYILV